jgi:integrase
VCQPNDQKKAARIEAQAAVEATIAEAKRQAAENQTVANLFGVWVVDGVNRKDGNKELRRIFDRNILPTIGAIPVRDLTETHLRDMLRPIIKAGTVRKAETMLLGVKQMMAWVEKRPPWRAMLIEGNPADLIPESSVIPPDYEGERDRVLSADEIRELREIFERTTAEYAAAPAGFKYEYERPLKDTSQLAIWICLGTLCRIGELLMARWEHVDFEARTWFIPKENVKGARGQKQAQTVHLSDFALRQFRTLHDLTGDTDWLFPAKHNKGHVCVSSVSKQIGDRQERFMERKPLKNRKHNNTLVLADGKNGNWTIHDLRRTSATMMQKLGVGLDIIDRCQNHVLAGSKVRRHYLHHDYADEKKAAWATLGSELDATLSNDNLFQDSL